MNSSTRYLLIFSISLLSLLLEFLQIRIFSFQYWYHLVYFVITTALLGMAVGGTAISLSEKLKSMVESKFYAFCFLGFAISVALGTLIISFLPVDFSSGQNIINVLSLMTVSIFATAPYVFFGLAITRVWFEFPHNAGKIYFFNLTGSVFGVLIFITLLQPLGAEHLIQGMVITALLIFVSIGFFLGWRAGVKRMTNFFIFCLIFFSLVSIFWLVIKPDKNKLYWLYGKAIFSEWNPVARIDVMKDSKGGLTILNDGDAQTPLGFNQNFHKVLVYAARGFNKPLGSVLVIGSGGGSDVRIAYDHGGSRDIDAVEINPTTVRLVKNKFASTIGNIFEQSGVHLFKADGRSFIKKTAKKYDVIMLMGVDNLSASNAGAYMMTENYPYTREAFEDYWDHLSDNGFVQISRFYYPRTPRETFRVFTTFFEALSKKGIEDPEKHIIVVVSTENISSPFGTVIVSKKSVDSSVITGIDKWLKDEGPVLNLNLGLLFPKLSPEVDRHGHDVFEAFVDGWKKDRGVSFYKNYFFDVKPATDDKPFFFQYGKLANVFRPIDIPDNERYFNNIRWQRPYFIIFSLLIQSSTIVFFLIFFSLRKFKTKLKEFKNLFYSLFYFGSIGLGFMFLELALIQKMILFLGHPIYSLVVVMPALLSGAAIGSLFSSRINVRQQRLVIIPFVCIILGMTFFLSRGHLNFLLGWDLRMILLTVFMGTAGLGFFAGIPFPSGINRLSHTRYCIPLAWAVNAGFSVIGSIVAVMLAMLFGFNLVMILSSVFYLLAFVLITVWDKNPL